MKVLVVDDDPLTRLILQRLLIRHFDCAVTECENGLDALEKLEQQSYAFVLLDNRMPLMSGVETLRVLRASDRFADLPVVMVSAVKDDQSVAEIVRLGISDYLIKPLHPERVVQRLTSVIQSLGRQRLGQPSVARQVQPDARRPLVIVDGSADFLHAFQSVLSPHYPIVETSMGTRALRLCLQTPPAALFVGSDIGVIGPDVLARRLRSESQLDDTRLFRIVGRSPEEEPSGPALFHGSLVRTFVPARLIDQVSRLLKARHQTSEGGDVMSALRDQLMSAVEQTFGMMLGNDVEWRDALHTDDVAVESEIVMASSDERTFLHLTLSTPLIAAREITQRMLGDASVPVSDEDGLASIAELANIVAGRLQNFLIDFGIRVRFSLPTAAARPSTLGPVDDPRETVDLNAIMDGISLRVRLARVTPASDMAR